VIWLEGVNFRKTVNYELQACVSLLKSHLEQYDLADSVALYSITNEPLSMAITEGCMDLDEACEADLLINLAYKMPQEVIKRFRRSVMVDIDPGLTQIWISEGQMGVARHDMYFTIGETVGQPGAMFPDCGLQWHYTPPPVYLPAWPPTQAESIAPYTTITSWWDGWVESQGQSYFNRKRDGFMQVLDLPRWTTYPLELAICGAADKNDRRMLQERGWRICDAFDVASSPRNYQRYIQNSRGEISCAKPSCIRLQNAWVSDRTLCYLASGKPAVIQHTGPSRFLPDSAGMFRFRNLEEAVRCLQVVEADYDQQCKLARELAEEYFDAQKVVKNVIEQALA
jgi:hypothetical protein